MEGVPEISSIASGTPVAKLKESWQQVVQDVILPLQDLPVQEIVIKLHQWLIVSGRGKYVESEWNILAQLDQQTYQCNCLCSTSFILLACGELGLFPGKISAATVPRHIFLLNSSGTRFYETTHTCSGVWTLFSSLRPGSIHLSKDRITIDSWARLCSNLTNSLFGSNPNLSSANKQTLVQKYPSLVDPNYYLYSLDYYTDISDIINSYNRFLDLNVNKNIRSKEQLELAYALIVIKAKYEDKSLGNICRAYLLGLRLIELLGG